MFCRKCGYKLEDDSIFCEKCGAKLRELQDDYGSQTVSNDQKHISEMGGCSPSIKQDEKVNQDDIKSIDNDLNNNATELFVENKSNITDKDNEVESVSPVGSDTFKEKRKICAKIIASLAVVLLLVGLIVLYNFGGEEASVKVFVKNQLSNLEEGYINDMDVVSQAYDLIAYSELGDLSFLVDYIAGDKDKWREGWKYIIAL